MPAHSIQKTPSHMQNQAHTITVLYVLSSQMLLRIAHHPMLSFPNLMSCNTALPLDLLADQHAPIFFVAGLTSMIEDW
jgi:hypothetical protein